MKAIISYNWICDEFDSNLEVYNSKKWTLNEILFLESIKPPYADLEEGWYIDEDKKICYFYTKDYNDKNELEILVKNLTPIDYKLDCFVKYEYSLIKLKNSECDDKEGERVKQHNKMNCLCKESSKENCFDEKENIKILKLNSCVKVNENESVYIKQESNAKPI
jgi:hypothetical protein